jgi:DNA-binding MarR family transcriptional regulator
MPRRAPPSTASPEPLNETAVQVLRQFRQVFNTVKTHFQQVEKKVGLGGAQVWALSVVRERPGIGVGELALAMNIQPSTASNLVRVLVERGLVATFKSETDRRAVQLKLLPVGARVLRATPGPFSGVLPTALASLDEKTLKRLQKDLALLIDALDADEAAGQIPLGD